MADVAVKKRAQILAKKIPASKWKEVGLLLGVDLVVLEDIEIERTNLYERRLHMLIKWQHMKGSQATNEALDEALKEAELQHLIESESQPVHQRSIPGNDQQGTIPAASASTSNTQVEMIHAEPEIPTKCFRLTNNPRGLCIIITYEKFDGRADLTRNGNSEDIDAAKKLFGETLHFHVHNYENLNQQQTAKKIDLWSESNYEEYDCFVCIVSSHGSNKGGGCFLTTDMKDVNVTNELIEPFKDNKSLQDKPKIFLINACRGGNKQRRVPDAKVPKPKLQAPIEADYLIFYSTVNSYESIRDIKSGTLFMQSICSCLGQMYKSKSLIDILLEANYSMDELAKQHGDCQVGMICTTLRMPIYFC